MAVKKIETLEEVVHDILQENGVCHLGPFENADEAFEVGRNLLPETWGTFLWAPGPDAGKSRVVLTLRLSASTPTTEGRSPVKSCTSVDYLYLGAEVYTLESLKNRLAAMESEQPTPEEETHPRIGGEYLVQCKDTGGVATAPRKVIAFDREEDTGRTYVWCQQNDSRTTCIVEELNWIPVGSKYAILAKAMHSAGLNKGQREVILAAFTEMNR